MCHSNITNFPCHSCIVLFLFDLTDCSIGKSFFSISFPHLLRNIERFSERTLQICRAVFLLPARSEHISQTRKSQPAEHLFLIHSTKKCTPAGYFLVHQYAKTVFQWRPLEVGVFLLEEDTTKKEAVALSNIFCWAAALLYAQMGAKSVVISLPSLINTVHSQTSLSACLISNCFVFNY